MNEERQYVHKIEDFVFLPGAIPGLRKLRDLGYVVVIVTNQAGIARGLYSTADFDHLTAYMLRELLTAGVEVSGVYFCPHHPEGQIEELSIECNCRKPASGMLITAAEDLGLDLTRSVLVGDKGSDIQAGLAAGVPINILVESGHTLDIESKNIASMVCSDLAIASKWIEDHITFHPVISSLPE